MAKGHYMIEWWNMTWQTTSINTYKAKWGVKHELPMRIVIRSNSAQTAVHLSYYYNRSRSLVQRCSYSERSILYNIQSIWQETLLEMITTSIRSLSLYVRNSQNPPSPTYVLEKRPSQSPSCRENTDLRGGKYGVNETFYKPYATRKLPLAKIVYLSLPGWLHTGY